MPEQIHAPTRVGKPSESLWGKKLWRAIGQDSQAPAHALEGEMLLGIVHGRPPDPTDPYMRGPVTLERNLIDPKALVRMRQARRPIPDEGAGMQLGTIHTEMDACFDVSLLPEGEQNFALPNVDSEQAVTPKIFSSSHLPLVLPLPDTLERDLKHSEGAEPKRRDVAKRPARSKPACHVAEYLDEEGRAWKESVPAVSSSVLQLRRATSRHQARAR